MNGDAVNKKKFKKCLRKSFQLSNVFNNETNKEINSIIKEQIEKCKRIRVHEDNVVNVKKE